MLPVCRSLKRSDATLIECENRRDDNPHIRDGDRDQKDYTGERKRYSHKSSMDQEARSFLFNFVPTGPERLSVSGIGELSLTVAGQGDVVITATVKGERPHGTMRGVLYVPGLGINLYSICTATDAGLKVVVADDAVSFSQDDGIILEGKRAGKKTIYHLNIQAEEHKPRIERALSAEHVEPLSLWHERFGHLNHKTVLRMSTLGIVFGFALFNDKLHLSTHCRRYLLGKIPRNSFPSNRTRGTQVGDIVHSDVCGPLHTCTPSGAGYFVTFKDDFSSFCDIQLLKHKSEVQEAFPKFNAKIKSETGQATKILRSDGSSANSAVKILKTGW